MREFKQIKFKESTRENRSQLIEMVRKLYDKVPPHFRWIASPLIYCHGIFQNLRLKLWIVTGNELTSRMPLSILCAAMDYNDTNVNYLIRLAFGASFRERDLGRAWLWKIPKMITKKGENCSLTIVQTRKRYIKLLRSSGWFYIPNWVIGEVDMPSDPTITKDSSLKSDLRRIRKHSLRFEVTRDSQQFDDFYHNMYVPYITMAHSSSAYINTYKYMRAGFQNCDLLLVTKQEERIGGILIVYEKSCPRLWSLGIRDANPEYLKAGAVGALFYFSLCHLKEKGFKKVNFGQSRAFLRDGVLQYKGKWSQRIVGTSRDGFALKVLSYTDAAKAFLQTNPFIFENSGCLNGAVFVDTEKPLSLKEVKEIDKHHFHPGLTKLFIYNLHLGSAVKQESVPAELSERIFLRSTDDHTRSVLTEELGEEWGSIGERT